MPEILLTVTRIARNTQYSWELDSFTFVPSNSRSIARQVCITLKPQYNEPRYSEFCNIENKTQLPFLGITKYITFDIVIIRCSE